MTTKAPIGINSSLSCHISAVANNKRQSQTSRGVSKIGRAT
jgi:hypothetical protein